MTSRIQPFESIPLWAQLDAAERCLIQGWTTEQRFGARKNVVQENMPFSGLHILKSGNIKLCKTGGSKEQILELLGPGDVLDPIPLFDGGTHAVTAKTMTESAVYRFAPEDAQRLLNNYPPVLNALLNLVSLRLRKLAALANDLAFKDVSARVCHVLLSQAIGDDAGTERLALERPLTRQELASMVGTAREVAWRALKKLERDGLIEIHGQAIVILDAAALASRT
jgi:CRP/FNR family transcriptional regulator